MDEGGSVDETPLSVYLSEEAPWKGLRGASSLGTLVDTLRKSPDMGISLHRGPFVSEGNMVCGGGARIPGTLIDE